MLNYKDDCGGFSPCISIALPVSLLAGILVAILFAFELIPGITTATWIVFGLGVLALIFVLLALVRIDGRDTVFLKSLKRLLPCLLAGIFGTILSSLAALSIVLTPSAIFSIILVGLVAFFFSLLISSLILLIKCVQSFGYDRFSEAKVEP
jgi:hypothetical protein